MVLIRTADLSDIQQIHPIYQELFTSSAELQPMHFRPAKQDEDFLVNIIQQEDSDILVAEEDGRIVGIALVKAMETPAYTCLVPHRYCYLMDFVVTERRRGCGIGSMLLDSVRAWGRERSLDFLQLSALANNQAARRFYERHGLAVEMVTYRGPLSDAGSSGMQ